MTTYAITQRSGAGLSTGHYEADGYKVEDGLLHLVNGNLIAATFNDWQSIVTVDQYAEDATDDDRAIPADAQHVSVTIKDDADFPVPVQHHWHSIDSGTRCARVNYGPFMTVSQHRPVEDCDDTCDRCGKALVYTDTRTRCNACELRADDEAIEVAR